MSEFSLHAQGWPAGGFRDYAPSIVLPARAGMALTSGFSLPSLKCSPCTRRDGPSRNMLSAFAKTFSLHAQGWPVIVGGLSKGGRVLPARAGMARKPHALLRT